MIPIAKDWEEFALKINKELYELMPRYGAQPEDAVELEALLFFVFHSKFPKLHHEMAIKKLLESKVVSHELLEGYLRANDEVYRELFPSPEDVLPKPEILFERKTERLEYSSQIVKRLEKLESILELSGWDDALMKKVKVMCPELLSYSIDLGMRIDEEFEKFICGKYDTFNDFMDDALSGYSLSRFEILWAVRGR